MSAPKACGQARRKLGFPASSVCLLPDSHPVTFMLGKLVPAHCSLQAIQGLAVKPMSGEQLLQA